ncbi:rho-GTPase-activating protein [Trichophyton mentagrophytes]|uniref:Rho-GTPase-activating protein 8 n=1 Tax=Trichophyton interdigitale TaxID=101480 RepID=A0A9P4YN17_9EURO|nr:Rho-GTPase-activating protein 8 [Trichophyton interdigitale]KAF3900736.1 Rho-GTPase-activating protein 8 [Trichophyton interdigitale]KAG8211602.1 Rho-GTPase-activating protein 8 [Trichophyton interdigitale]GBF61012.1 rho-GTPase-activating protein [Trichophyton mentagrophytes]
MNTAVAVPGFADSFWTPDYATGIHTLFTKLHQGIVENQQILTMAQMRAEAERVYAAQLGAIAPAIARKTGGFERDDGASVRKAFDCMQKQMVEEQTIHQKISSSIQQLVIQEFSRWASEHEARVVTCEKALNSRLKEYAKQCDEVSSLNEKYLSKCRQIHDREQQELFAFQEPESATASPKHKQLKAPTIVLPDPLDEDPEPVELGDIVYSPEQLKQLLKHMLETIPMGEVKVRLLGTYLNTSLGSDIVEYLQKHLGASSLSYAERIGQDMADNGFITSIGAMGPNPLINTTFTGSSRSTYQWDKRVFQMTGVPEKKKPLTRSATTLSRTSTGTGSDDSPVDSPTLTERFAAWNPLRNQLTDETPMEILKRQADEANERYKHAVKHLDAIRCKLEEEMFHTMKFMQQCELHRLEGIKTVVIDFSSTISNVIPSLQSTMDRIVLHHEAMQPQGDLRYMLENYRTGSFCPKVAVYESGSKSTEEQTFGVDLETLTAAEGKKRVPVLVTGILTYLDRHYLDLEGDDARRAIWLRDVPLTETHKLRAKLNRGRSGPIVKIDDEVETIGEKLQEFEMPVVASVLRLYLLELPDSIVSSKLYEIFRTIYTTTRDTSDENRIRVLQSTLGQLPLPYIATLDAITTHFWRLVDLTIPENDQFSTREEIYISALASTLAPCILRPRVQNHLSMDEKHSHRLVRDLIVNQKQIFGELRRLSSKSSSTASRPRAISTDESNRRANMEERNRAIASRARATSPAPSPRHRRDRSVGSSGSTRFPVSVSGATTSERKPVRQSLEVPDPSPAPIDIAHNNTNGSSEGTPATAEDTNASADAPTTDRAATPPSATTTTPASAVPSSVTNEVKKTGSLSRSSRYSHITGIKRDEGDNSATDVPPKPVGVTLEDKPIDD